MKLMKKIPGGTLLIPMLVSALINTIHPTLFHVGGVTEAFFAGSGLNFILGAAIFISGCLLKLSTIKHVFQRYFFLLVFRTALCVGLGILFFKVFGLEGFLGISLVAFIATLTSINPSLFLAIMEDFGDEVDVSAFGLVSLFATPVVALFIFGLTQPTELDFMPILSMVIPLVLGIIIGNTDHELGKFLVTGMPFVIFMLGWCVGAKINLLDAFTAGMSGVVMTVLYYVLTALPLLFVEKKIMKRSGIATFGISTIAGLSASVPLILAETNPEIAIYGARATAIVTMGVVISAFASPFLAKMQYDKIKK